MMKPLVCAVLLAQSLLVLHAQEQQWQYVDPRIGSVGVGRTFPGPSMPYGMAKPGPDCTVMPNAGWAPMPEVVTGFSQTHVSGTGGGQKYGNILIQPGVVPQYRTAEEMALGYYAATFEGGIRTEITTAERCAFYRLHYPVAGSLLVDATHFLGKDSIPNLRERQQFVSASVTATGPRELCGHSTVSGGWNNGDPYTVFFCLQSDRPFTASPVASPSSRKTPRRDAAAAPTSSLLLNFRDTLVQLRIGLSYVSTEQARRNIPADVSFDQQLLLLREAWQQRLAPLAIDGTESQKRQFYTALYHTMLMPVDKTGENPRWADTPYYDDYYAIWDTYRTSMPLLTLIDPDHQVEMLQSLLNIYRNEGYLPDARSGDCNGRTQGGSNADVALADAFVKGLGRDTTLASLLIDWPLALEAMLHDADADPGADHEKHGRGGLTEYNRWGYVPYGIPRAGTRTIEYAYCDYCIAQVARGLGREDLYQRFLRQSRNWRNLWRGDYEWDGVRGYIMPREAPDAEAQAHGLPGRWLDSVPWGSSRVFHPRIPYTPVTKVAPWHLPWWNTFFYEALSAEYSLSIPHDVEGLMEACGGKEAFRQRLDRFFERGHYNVGNEPSFLTPCLYHWLGRPDLSSDRVRQIIADNYSDAPDGLPGNDDSGAMSSWLAFHMLGLYPNAGQDYYLLHAPLVPSYRLTLPNGRTLEARIHGQGTRFMGATLNGRPLPDARITHAALLEGGTLLFHMAPALQFAASFTLNRQFRTWPVSLEWEGDTLLLRCKETLYRIPRSVVAHAEGFCWLSPQQDGVVHDAVQGTFLFLSTDALDALRRNGTFRYDDITWRRIDETPDAIRVEAVGDCGQQMLISLRHPLPFVLEMKDNPLGIDWTLHFD